MMNRSMSHKLLSTGLFVCVVISSWGGFSTAEEASSQDRARQWEEIASLRYQAAIGHESRAEQKEALVDENPGEALKGAGDDKVSASDGFKKASEHWKKAAEKYSAIGELDNQKKAQYNSDSAWDAAKRTLREAADFHMRAAKVFEDENNLGNKIEALKKVASDLEALMKME